MIVHHACLCVFRYFRAASQQQQASQEEEARLHRRCFGLWCWLPPSCAIWCCSLTGYAASSDRSPPPCCMAARRSQHPINDQPQPNPCASHLHECLTLDCAIINSCPLPGGPSGCCQHPVPSHHACLQSMLGQTDDRQRLQQAQPGQSVVPPNGDDA